jgi:hypothetical protein
MAVKARKRNRAPWILVTILGMLVLGGTGLFLSSYRSGLPPPSLDAATLPKRAWGFVYYGGVADGEDRVELFYLVRLGLYQVRLEWPIGRR